MLVVADTSPLNYLVLIGEVDLLSHLFGQVCVPDAVIVELQHERTPELVRSWVTAPPVWPVALPMVPCGGAVVVRVTAMVGGVSAG